MSALPKTHGIKGKQGGWTPEKRLEQSRIMRERQIWLKSTGPRTAEGKAASSKNARKPDYEARQIEQADDRRIMLFLRLQKLYTKTLGFQRRYAESLAVEQNEGLEMQLFFLENELDKLMWGFWGGKIYSPYISACGTG